MNIIALKDYPFIPNMEGYIKSLENAKV